jgi:hypothetical protein
MNLSIKSQDFVNREMGIITLNGELNGKIVFPNSVSMRFGIF